MNKKPNFWIYANSSEQFKVSSSLILFGAETFKSAKVIKDINQLKNIYILLNNNEVANSNSAIYDFIFEYLIDSIKIIIFFENYMKAKLILSDYCVHKIKKDIEEFKDLYKKQFKEPITLEEINSIEHFEIHESKNTIFHRAISDTTLGFNELINSKNYLSCFEFDIEIIDFLKELNLNRNRLHFNDSIHFQLTGTLIDSLENLNRFVDKCLKDVKNHKFYYNLD